MALRAIYYAMGDGNSVTYIGINQDAGRNKTRLILLIFFASLDLLQQSSIIALQWPLVAKIKQVRSVFCTQYQKYVQSKA
jgi:hypothetical protein